MPKWKPTWMPDYIPEKEESDAYQYCIRNNIRISPCGLPGQRDKWGIEISLDGKKWNRSPYEYDKDTIWVAYYNFCKYYYEKRKKEDPTRETNA